MKDNLILSMGEISEEEIINEFNNDISIWPSTDIWHNYTHNKIKDFIASCSSIIESSTDVINAGSSGVDYGISDTKTLHIDLSEKRIKNKPNYLITNIKKTGLPSNKYDLIVCVGSVLNYADAILTLSEFSRLLTKEGHLILEFECSNTLELLFSKKLNSEAVIIKSFYRSKESTIWYYSEKWIEHLLKQDGIHIIKKDRWHLISALIYGITKKPKFSSYFKGLDAFAKYIPLLNKYSSNVIFLCSKIN